MINLSAELTKDIEAGILSAIEAGDLPALKEMPNIVVGPPKDPSHGEYASPMALVLTRVMKKPPMDIVEAVAKHLPKKEYIGKLEAVAPGFLNVRISPGWMTSRLDNILEHDPLEDITVGAGKSVNIEFISANPTGPLTLGNARTAFTADTLANVMQSAGFNVTREYYINDAGGQIAKLGESVLRRALENQGETVEFPEGLYVGEYIKDVARDVAEDLKETQGKEFTKEDLDNKEILAWVSEQSMRKMLERIKHTIEHDLKIHFDVWTSERAIRDSGAVEAVLEKLRKMKKTYEKDGTEFLKTTEYGDDKDRVLVKKDGEYAYIMPDLGYHQNKFDRGFDYIFTVLGADHQGHIPKLKAAMQALGNDITKLHFPVGQWFRLVRGGEAVKMSKRAGQIFSPSDLIAEVGYDVARFFLVQHKLDTHMDFDLDLAKEQSDRNPVYYLQYAYVRFNSILRRAKEDGVIEDLGMKFDLPERPALTHEAEMRLMRAMYKLPEVVSDISRSFAVHQLAYYALDLAKEVHYFYNQVQVLSVEEEDVRMSRLQLVLAGRAVLSKTMDLLGITKLEIM